MQSFIAAVVVALVVAVGASFILSPTTAPQAFTTEGARISAPGNNLMTF